MGERSNKATTEPLSPEETYFRLFYTPCCKKWLHLTCIQQQAYNAGLYFIKCPLCNDKDMFKKAVVDHGIYIPDKDASWEESAAFHDLERRYEHCDATQCLCPKGRAHCDDAGSWEMYVCFICGSSGMHLACLPLPMQQDDAPDWICDFCLLVERRLESNRGSQLLSSSAETLAHLPNGDPTFFALESSQESAIAIDAKEAVDDQIAVDMQLTDISNSENVENCKFF
jgi:hypothetical protein